MDIVITDPEKPFIKNPVGDRTARSDQLLSMRKLSRTLLLGTKGMFDAGEEFMPKQPHEEPASYANRLAITVLYGAFKETVTRQAGKLFIEEVQPVETLPDQLKLFLRNVDGQGRALTPFCLDVMQDAIADGVAYIFVDYPKVAQGASLADTRRQKTRPYWVKICANQVLGWQTALVGGETVLTQVRIAENVAVADGKYGTRVSQRVRVIMPRAFELYELKQDSLGREDWILIDEGVTTQDEIQIVPVYANRSGFFEGEPTLQTLAEMCLEHWNSTSEQRVALSFLRFAMLAISGAETGADVVKVVVGPRKVINLPVNGKAEYVEHSGKGIEAGAADLTAIEERMRHAGMQLRVENAGKVTATATAVDSQETNAGLKAVAKGLEGSITKAIKYTGLQIAITLPETEESTVTVYDQFAAEEIPGTVDDMVKLRAQRDLSRDTLWEELKRRRILSDDFDPVTEAVKCDKEIQDDMKNLGTVTMPLTEKVGSAPLGTPTPQPTK